MKWYLDRNTWLDILGFVIITLDNYNTHTWEINSEQDLKCKVCGLICYDKACNIDGFNEVLRAYENISCSDWLLRTIIE